MTSCRAYVERIPLGPGYPFRTWRHRSRIQDSGTADQQHQKKPQPILILSLIILLLPANEPWPYTHIIRRMRRVATDTGGGGGEPFPDDGDILHDIPLFADLSLSTTGTTAAALSSPLPPTGPHQQHSTTVPTTASPPCHRRPSYSQSWRRHLGLMPPPNATHKPSKRTHPTEGEEEGATTILLQQQRLRYQDLCHSFPWIEDDDDDDDETTTTTPSDVAHNARSNSLQHPQSSEQQSIVDQQQQYQQQHEQQNQQLDPLSAMVQERDESLQRQRQLELDYKKQQHHHHTRRQRRLVRNRHDTDTPRFQHQQPEEPDPGAAHRQMIDKDLHRLPHPHPAPITTTPTSSSSSSSSTITPITPPPNPPTPIRRVSMLRRVLCALAGAHPEAGYLQGMHEVASHVLYALEREELEMTHHHHQQQQPVDPQPADSKMPQQSTTLEEDTRVSATTPTTIEADCFLLTERIITLLYPAYDVRLSTTTDTIAANAATPQNLLFHNHQQPLALLTRRILQQTRHIQWPLLHDQLMHCTAHTVPAALIFTKWIRLLFSREIATAEETSGNAAPPQPTTTTNPSPTRTLQTNSGGTAANVDGWMPRRRKTHADAVVELWDALFAAAYQVAQQDSTASSSSSSSSYSPRSSSSNDNNNKPPTLRLSTDNDTGAATTTVPPLQRVVEAFCVARLWHHGLTILHLSPHPDLLLHWFMNIPAEDGGSYNEMDKSQGGLSDILTKMRVLLGLETTAKMGSASTLYPVSAEILALTAQRSDESKEPFYASTNSYANNSQVPSRIQQANNSTNSTSTSSSLWENAGLFLSSAAPRLSVLTEQLAAKTQSIQKIISEEWEQHVVSAQPLPEHMRQHQEFNYSRTQSHANQHPLGPPYSPSSMIQQQSRTGCATPHAGSSDIYNLDYYADSTLRQVIHGQESPNANMAPMSSSNSTQPAVSIANNSHTMKSDEATSWSSQLQQQISILHSFVSDQANNGGPATNRVPRQVLEALANLQVLQQEIYRNGQ